MMSIAFASFKEVVRKKIILLVGIMTLVYLGCFSLILYYAFKDIPESSIGTAQMYVAATQYISVLGFYFSSMIVAFLTIMASIGAVSSEIESGVIHAILTKPIPRTQYVLGKYLGVAMLTLLYSVFLYSAVILISRMANATSYVNLGMVPILKGLVLFILEPLVILSLSIFGSVHLKTLTNGIFVVSIYILGFIGAMIEQIGALIGNTSLFKWGILSSLISPFDSVYRKMISHIFSHDGFNPLFGPNLVANTTPSNWMMVYVFLYLLGFLLLSIRSFLRKDIS